jgi:hypothetical protein
MKIILQIIFMNSGYDPEFSGAEFPGNIAGLFFFNDPGRIHPV